MRSSKYRVTIPTEVWAKMLRDSGAPEPWADPDAAEKFAAAIRRRRANEISENTVRKNAQIAIATLKNDDVIHEMIRAYEQRIMLHSRDRSAARVLAVGRLTQALRVLEDALPVKRSRPALGWHLDAVELFGLYVNHVNPRSGRSANGPAVKFIEKALTAMGHGGGRSADAIAKILQRRRFT
jgi:hypothetical protein